eukprot:6195156-Pleurochrysis_carterae.AAC.2
MPYSHYLTISAASLKLHELHTNEKHQSPSAAAYQKRKCRIQACSRAHRAERAAQCEPQTANAARLAAAPAAPCDVI